MPAVRHATAVIQYLDRQAPVLGRIVAVHGATGHPFMLTFYILTIGIISVQTQHCDKKSWYVYSSEMTEQEKKEKNTKLSYMRQH